MFKKFFIIFIASICLLGLNIAAFSSEGLNFNGFISDNANLLSNETKTSLNSLLYELQQKTKADVAVVTLNSLKNSTIEQTALDIGRSYKIGDKTLNNGAVILIAPNERQARIEIGYGLEGIITDAKAGRILDDYMLPSFKEGNYETGITKGTIALAFNIADGYNVKLTGQRPATANNTSDEIYDIIIIIVFLLYLFLFGNIGPFGGGFSRGGFGGGIKFGGGGGFGGGGSSRRW